MPRQGQAHHNAKLTDVDVLEMRRLRESRPWLWSYRALADYLGCGQSTARDIVTYRTRRDIENAEICFSAMAKETA